MDQKVRWGFIGAGMVAGQFAADLLRLPGAEITAVAARTGASAKTFGQRFNIKQVHTDPAALLAQADVDIIYVATPHTMHKQHCIAALLSGKAVVCEKPLAVNAAEAVEVLDLARGHNLFFMEAMWMLCNPLIQRTRALIERGAIGKPRMMLADFGIPMPFDPNSRFFNRQLGGGALLDRGVYGIALANYLFGKPNAINVSASIGQTGVDEQTTALLNWDNGIIASISATLRAWTKNEAWITGESGSIRLHEPFYRPERLSLYERAIPQQTGEIGSSNWKQKLKASPSVRKLARALKIGSLRPRQQIMEPVHGNGYGYEAAEAMRCIRAGLTESPMVPHNQSLTVMQLLDEVREKMNLDYSADQ